MSWFRQAAESARAHTGLHYVPSFSTGLGNGVNDDIEEEEHAGAIHGSSSPRAAPPSSLRTSRSNRTDDAWPAFDTVDIHKVNVSKPVRDASKLYDRPRGVGDSRGPSVWQYILDSEKKREEGAGQYSDVLQTYGSE